MPTKFKSKETISSSEDESERNYIEPAARVSARSLDSLKPAHKANGKKSARQSSSFSSTVNKSNPYSKTRARPDRLPRQTSASVSEEDEQVHSGSSTRSESSGSAASSNIGKRKATVSTTGPKKRLKPLPTESVISAHTTDDDSDPAREAEAVSEQNSGSVDGSTSSQLSSDAVREDSDAESRRSTAGKDERTLAKREPSAPERRPAHLFHPPAGFGPISLSDGSFEIEQLLSRRNLDGKKLLHFVVPSSIPIASFTNISDDQLRNGGVVVQHNGAEYELKIDRSEISDRETLLLPASGQAKYKAASVDVSRTFVLQQAPRRSLPAPNLDRMQVDSHGALKQPSGLKTRYWPPGFEPKASEGSIENEAGETGTVHLLTHARSFKNPDRYESLERTSKRSVNSERRIKRMNMRESNSDADPGISEPESNASSSSSSSSTGDSKSGDLLRQQRIGRNSSNDKRLSKDHRATHKTAEAASVGQAAEKLKSGKSSGSSSSSAAATSSSGTEDSDAYSSSD